MKALLPLALLVSMVPASIHAQEKPTEEFLLELYEYCVEEYGSATENRDADVLLCINEDLEYNDMVKFKSMAELKKALGNRINSQNNTGV